MSNHLDAQTKAALREQVQEGEEVALAYPGTHPDGTPGWRGLVAASCAPTARPGARVRTLGMISMELRAGAWCTPADGSSCRETYTTTHADSGSLAPGAAAHPHVTLLRLA